MSSDPNATVTSLAAPSLTETMPLSNFQKISAARLHESWTTIPHVTHHDEADVTLLEAVRRHQGDRRISGLSCTIKALVAALQAFPQFNATLDLPNNALVLKKYFHIGIAIDTPRGLVVGVVRNCDQLGLWDLTEHLTALATRAREKGLAYKEMIDGCFTVSSLQSFGGTAFTPIINLPELAILGLSQIQERAAPGPSGGVTWRKKLPLSMSYDHRVINGAAAAKFVAHLRQSLESPESLGLTVPNREGAL